MTGATYLLTKERPGRNTVKSQVQGRIVMITGDRYRNVKSGGIYVLRKSKADTILLQEVNRERQVLMSYKEFEEGYVKLRSPGQEHS